MTADEVQLQIVRELARQYPRFEELTRLPDSLMDSSHCNALDKILGMAIAYAMNEVLDRILQESQSEDNQKQPLSVPGTLVSPFVGIPALEYDPMDLVGSSL